MDKVLGCLAASLDNLGCASNYKPLLYYVTRIRLEGKREVAQQSHSRYVAQDYFCEVLQLIIIEDADGLRLLLVK
jgi:hypothetical protein